MTVPVGRAGGMKSCWSFAGMPGPSLTCKQGEGRSPRLQRGDGSSGTGAGAARGVIFGEGAMPTAAALEKPRQDEGGTREGWFHVSLLQGKLPPREKEETCERLPGWKAAQTCWWLMQGGRPPNPCLSSPPPSCQHPGAAPSASSQSSPEACWNHWKYSCRLQEPFPSPRTYPRAVASGSVISSIILHLFFKGMGWKRPHILHESPKGCKELFSSPDRALISLSLKISLSQTSLAASLHSGKKDDLLPWYSRGCLSQKCFTQNVSIHVT